MRRENLESIKSSSCARTSDAQRGFVIIVALVLALLYFMLMTLILIDSSRAQAEAQRFRARMVASILAEDAAEKSCVQIVNNPYCGPAVVRSDQGTADAKCSRESMTVPTNFSVASVAQSAGVIRQKADVQLTGAISADGRISIEFSQHSQ